MSITEVISTRIPKSIMEEVRKTSAEDVRKQADQINYLLKLGLEARESHIAILSGHTQLDPTEFQGAGDE